MDNITLGNVIAERELEFTPRQGPKYTVAVRIGTPYGGPDQWFCPYQIEGGGKQRTFAMAGTDSMQALVLTTRVLSAELDLWARNADGDFSFDGQPDLMLPPSP
jgi:hypothetical protein